MPTIKKTFHRGGIHPDPCKLTAGMPVRPITPAPELRIMLSQCIGAPSRPVVKPGDIVRRGQMLAEAGGFVGAPIHSPCAAKVVKTERVRNAQGLWQEALVLHRLTPEELEEYPGYDKWPAPRTPEEVEALSPAQIIGIVGESGIVGLGGATFPTRVKLTVPEGKRAWVVVVNAAECEPYLTCDDQLMRACPDEIIKGVELLMRATGAPQGIIGIEANKPKAAERLKAAAAESDADITVQLLRTRYPQGGEKQLIEALTGRQVPLGGLPIDAGAIVDNVATVYAVYEAVYLRRPLTRRVVTVTGPDVTYAGNYAVDNGTSISDLIETAGGLPKDTGKIIAGGPMMGHAVSQPGAPVTKGTSGIVMLPEKLSLRKPEKPCIRCAKCVSACPMGLQPYLLMTLSKMRLAPEVRAEGVMNCMECGCCAYTCPSARPIVDYIRLGKQLVRALPRE